MDWTLRTLTEWKELLKSAANANWMQTWAYAEASLHKDWIPSQMVGFTCEGRLVAIAALQKIKLGPFLYVRINRGPLWLDRQPSEVDQLAIAEALRAEFPKSIFNWIKWLPEFEFSRPAQDALQRLHFRLAHKNFQTIWIDLELDLVVLKKNLRQKWRHSLHQFERSSTNIRVDSSVKSLHSFLNFYSLYKKQKNYSGPSSDFLNIEFRTASKAQELTLLWAFKEGLPVAGIALHHHGQNVSYRAGWNSVEGRKTKAHYGLLWFAIQHFKQLGFKKLDLGGVLPIEASGLTHFKEGLMGKKTHYDILIG